MSGYSLVLPLRATSMTASTQRPQARVLTGPPASSLRSLLIASAPARISNLDVAAD
jgi:hypothetical protein